MKILDIGSGKYLVEDLIVVYVKGEHNDSN